MRNIWKTIKQNRLIIVTILVFIYPVIPLAVYAVLFAVGGGAELLFGNRGFFGSRFDADMLLIFFWGLGGVAGVVGAILVIINRKNLLSLILISLGLISYLGVLVMLFSNMRYSVFTVLYACYLVSVAIIVLIHIVQISKEINHQRLPFEVIDLDPLPNTNMTSREKGGK